MPAASYEELEKELINTKEALKTARELNQELRDTMWHQKGDLEAQLKTSKQEAKDTIGENNSLRNHIHTLEISIARYQGYITAKEPTKEMNYIQKDMRGYAGIEEDYSRPQFHEPRWFEVK